MRRSWTLNSFAVRLSDIAQTGPGRSSLTPSSDFVVLRAAEFLLRGSRSSAAGQADSSEAHRQEEFFFVALKTLRLQPVWPRRRGEGFQDVRPR